MISIDRVILDIPKSSHSHIMHFRIWHYFLAQVFHMISYITSFIIKSRKIGVFKYNLKKASTLLGRKQAFPNFWFQKALCHDLYTNQKDIGGTRITTASHNMKFQRKREGKYSSVHSRSNQCNLLLLRVSFCRNHCSKHICDRSATKHRVTEEVDPICEEESSNIWRGSMTQEPL